MESPHPARRQVLKSAAALAALQALPLWAAEGRPQVELALPDGVLQLTALDEAAVRVRVVPREAATRPVPPSRVLLLDRAPPPLQRSVRNGRIRWRLPRLEIACTSSGRAARRWNMAREPGCPTTAVRPSCPSLQSEGEEGRTP